MKIDSPDYIQQIIMNDMHKILSNFLFESIRGNTDTIIKSNLYELITGILKTNSEDHINITLNGVIQGVVEIRMNSLTPIGKEFLESMGIEDESY